MTPRISTPPLLEIPFLSDIIAIRRDLHAHPELAFHEARTAALVARELAAYGLEVHRDLAGTGVVGVLKKGTGQGHGQSDGPRAIGLRADMDALPIMEVGQADYASTQPGRMHACGHDGHTAMLLGAARYLSAYRDRLDFEGVVYFIFQPAEEVGGGAQKMLENGLFRRFPMDAVFGLHNWPGLPVGRIAAFPGPIMAGSSCFEITVRGQGCHAGMPHQGIDALVVASHLTLALQTIVAREIDPSEAAVVSVTQIHGGDALNVIPEEAVLRGTIRTLRPEVERRVEQAVMRLGAGIGQTFGASVEVSFLERYPATINHSAETALCQRAAARAVGDANLLAHAAASMGAEDFAYMLREKAGCYVWLGNGDEAGSAGARSLHNPRYDFNDAAIPFGIAYWVSLVECALGAAAQR